MGNFAERLVSVCARRRSHLCVGLDPEPEKILTLFRSELLRMLESQPLELHVVTSGENEGKQAPLRLDPSQLVEESEVVKDLICRLIVSATAPYAAAFKPNAAFFEFEESGLVEIPKHVHASQLDHLVIFDGKRGDIGNTSKQYAEAILERGGFDAVTVNPLMGRDAVEPFLAWPERGVFLLCLTSNPGAADFLLAHDLYLRIAEKAVEWNSRGNVGLVVGATRPEYAARVREVAPELPLLIPGIGAQGGNLGEILDAVQARTNPRFLVNVSRSILFPSTVEETGDPVKAVMLAAQSFRDQIEAALR